MSDLSQFDCPRCGQAVDERFYGPCGACRDELGSTLVHAAREVEVERFVPTMNVVPNQVATKE